MVFFPATRDERKGKNWERFEFDNCAPLDSDANLSYFGGNFMTKTEKMLQQIFL